MTTMVSIRARSWSLTCAIAPCAVIIEPISAMPTRVSLMGLSRCDAQNRASYCSPPRGFGDMAVELGLGLVSLGREWGVHKGQPPSRDEALALLAAAVRLGVKFFDTAPAYGASEVLLSEYLAQAGPTARDIT